MEDVLNIFTAKMVFIKSLHGPSNETSNDLNSGKIHFHYHFCSLYGGLLEKVLSSSEI